MCCDVQIWEAVEARKQFIRERGEAGEWILSIDSVRLGPAQMLRPGLDDLIATDCSSQAAKNERMYDKWLLGTSSPNSNMLRVSLLLHAFQ